MLDTVEEKIHEPECRKIKIIPLKQRNTKKKGLNKWIESHWTVGQYQVVQHVIQFSSVTQSCLTLCDPMDCSMPGLPVNHQLLEFIQSHVHWVCDAIQSSHPLLSPFPPAFNLSQHQGLFKWVHSLPQVAKVLEFQRQHQSFQWIFRTDFL